MSKTGTLISLAEDQEGKNPSIVTHSNTLPADSFGWQMARGKVPNTELFVASGRLVTTGAVTDHMIWPNGTFTIPPQTGVQITIASTSDQDAAAGTGIRSVFILYLDADGNHAYEVKALNGTTPVTTVATDIKFIQDVIGVTFGTGGDAAGVITFSYSGSTIAEIAEGEVRSSSSARMVPAGRKAYICGATVSSISGTAATSSLISLSSTELYGFSFVEPLIFIPLVDIGIQDGSESYYFPILIEVSAGNIFAMRATADKSATITASWYGWLENV